MNLIKLKEHHILIRTPYFIKCFLCDCVITGNTKEEVMIQAVGWKYDYEQDRIFCKNCVLNIIEKEV